MSPPASFLDTYHVALEEGRRRRGRPELANCVDAYLYRAATRYAAPRPRPPLAAKKAPRRKRASLADVMSFSRRHASIPSPMRRVMRDQNVTFEPLGARVASQAASWPASNSATELHGEFIRFPEPTAGAPQPFAGGPITSVRACYNQEDLDSMSGRSVIPMSSQQLYEETNRGWRARDGAGGWGEGGSMGTAFETLGTRSLDDGTTMTIATAATTTAVASQPSLAPSLALCGTFSIGVDEGGVVPLSFSGRRQPRKPMAHWSSHTDARPALRGSIAPKTSTYHTLPQKR